MEGPSLGVELEPQLLAYATATAMRDLSLICDLHHSSQQLEILNPLSRAREIEPVSSWILVGFVTTEPQWELQDCFFKKWIFVPGQGQIFFPTFVYV